MIILQYFEHTDFEQLIEWSGDDEFLLQWAGPQFQYPLTKDQLSNFLNEANNKNTSNKFIYKVIDESINQTVGHISLGGIDRYNRSGRIGKVLVGNQFRGKGYGKRMIYEILRIGFEELNLHRISLGVFDFNVTAITCYERSGFVREGLIRDARRYKDTFWNLIEMSILEDEWRSMNTH